MSSSPISSEVPTSRELTYQQVQQQFPEAWEELPKSYQADSCLTFYLQDHELSADHDLHAETYVWLPTQSFWTLVNRRHR